MASWFHARTREWSASLPKGPASTHVFRKTGLQFARSGADLDAEVARAAKVSAGVMMHHYVSRDDEQKRSASNDTFHRILGYLLREGATNPGLAARYGYASPVPADPLEGKLREAYEAKEWSLVGSLSAELERRRRSSAG